MRYPMGSAVCSGATRHNIAAEQNKVAARASNQGPGGGGKTKWLTPLMCRTCTQSLSRSDQAACSDEPNQPRATLHIQQGKYPDNN